MLSRLVLGETLRGVVHASTALRILQQVEQIALERLVIDIGIGMHHSSAGIGEQAGIRRLMVGGRQWIRHQYGGNGEGGDLGNRGLACARLHEVGSGQDIAHVFDVGAHLPALGLLVGQTKGTNRIFVTIFAGRVDHIKVVHSEQIVLEPSKALI